MSLQEYSVDQLDLIQVGQLMTRDPETLPGDMLIAKALAFFRDGAAYRSYPVVDGEGRLLGWSRLALRWRCSDNLGEATLAETLSDVSQPTAFPDSPSSVVADLIVETGIGRIPNRQPRVPAGGRHPFPAGSAESPQRDRLYLSLTMPALMARVDSRGRAIPIIRWPGLMIHKGESMAKAKQSAG